MMRIAALEHTGSWTATAIVVHHHRILLGSIEMRWQIVTAAKSVATGIHEVPSLALALLDVFQQAGTEIIYEQRLLRLGAHLVESVGIGCALSRECHFRSSRCDGEALDVLLRSLEQSKLTRLRVQLEEMHAVFILGCEVNVAIRLTPIHALHVRIEILGHRANLLIRQIHQIELGVNHARNLSLLHILSNSIESLRRTSNENTLAVWRELGTAQELTLLYQRLNTHIVQIETIERVESSRTLGKALLALADEQIAGICGNIVEINIMVAEGKRLENA